MDILSMLPKVNFPGTVYFGKSSLLYLKSLEGQRNLVVISKTVQERHGSKIGSLLEKGDIFPFSSEPKKSDVETFQEKVREGEYENVIGIGGGSVMDLAKTARLADGRIRLIMIPTTPGTGSEASRYSVMINDNMEKEALTSENLVPDVVLLDPGFLASLPRHEIASSSLDIIGHAVESLVSRMSNPLADSLAIKAMDMVFMNAERACEGDMHAMESLQLAGFLAGLAQSSASVGAAHAFAHHVGPKTGLPHGKAVGMFLPEVVKLNMQKTDRYKKLDSSFIVSSRDFIRRLEELMQRIGFQKKEFVVGGKASADTFRPKLNVEDAARKIKNDACMKTNPCVLSEEEIKGILEKVSHGQD